MATFLYKALLAMALGQGGSALPPRDSLAPPRDSVAPNPTEGQSWGARGRRYLGLLTADYTSEARRDTVWTHAVLDSADAALARAAESLGPVGVSPEGDSARVLRVQVWSERALLAWESGGITRGPEVWGPVPVDLRLSPVLEELGENLLRACPTHGVLLTAAAVDSYAAWFMRYARGLRPDLLVVPLTVWRTDPAFRVRAAADLKLGPAGRGEGWLAALVQRRPACISMAFERPPAGAAHPRWTVRPLVWVAGRNSGDDPVPPRDFVFAALRMALDDRDPWARSALALYARAARNTRALCETLTTFKIAREDSGCRG
jgi:hypothetical protein